MQLTLELEIWAPLQETHLFEVSDLGRVRNAITRKIIKSHVSNEGYDKVFLKFNGKQHPRFVHRLVAQAFLLPDAKRNTVDHIDRNRRNNRPENLKWATMKEQCQNKNARKGSTKAQPISIMDDFEIKEFPTLKACAKFLGCHVSSVVRLRDGKQKTCKGWVLV